jgi:hypothetical protein
MTPSAYRTLLALAAGLLFSSPLARGAEDAVPAARSALAAGDFTAMQSLLGPHLAANPADSEARVLRALATLARAAETDLPHFLRTKIGARSASLDLAGGDNLLRFPRSAAYAPTTPFTVAGPFFEYTPEINLYLDDDREPGVSFENRGATPLTLTFTVSTAGDPGLLDLDTTFLLNGELLAFVDGFQPEYPLSLNSAAPGISVDPVASTVSVTLEPGDALSILVVYSPGQLRFTPTAPLPAGIRVGNGQRSLVTPDRFSPTANLADAVTFAAQLDTGSIAPAIADLANVPPGFSVTLFPEETGLLEPLVLAYPDLQLILAQLKVYQGLRRLALPYNVAQKLSSSLFEENTLAQFVANRSFLRVRRGNFSADLSAARTLFGEAVAHYFAAGHAGLWTRPAPPAGTYLFATDPVDPGLQAEALALDTAMAQFRDALFTPVPIAELDEDFATDSTLPDLSSVHLAPLFGPRALELRLLAPVLAPDSQLIVPGSSTRLLTSGLLPDLGTAWWENYLSTRGLSDDQVLALFAKPRFFVVPPPLTTVAEGTPARLRVVAEAYPAPTYQWFRGSGRAATPVPGATSPIFTLPAATRDDAGLYTVRVSNTIPGRSGPVTSTIASKPVRLVVTYPPEILSAPVSLTRLAGRPLRFSVVGSAVPPPAYQWLFNGAPIPKATKATLSFQAASPLRAGAYSVRLTNSRGEITSTPVSLTVHERPRFTAQPLRTTVPAGGSATLTVAVAGNPAPTLQWYRGNARISTLLVGATSPTLVIPNATPEDAGTYFAIATNLTVDPAGTGEQTNNTYSRAAALLVTPPPPSPLP